MQVDGKANIFAAGLSSVPGFAGGGGLLPVEVSLLGGVNEVSFSTTGEVNCCGSTVGNTPPDGSFGSPTNISSYGGISGIKTSSVMMLVGVFLGPEPPSPQAPPILAFNTIGINFTTLSAELQQTFFIGDGFTSGGTKQTFVVPAGATRLFLGIADAQGFIGNPNGDNTGAFEVTVSFQFPSGVIIIAPVIVTRATPSKIIAGWTGPPRPFYTVEWVFVGGKGGKKYSVGNLYTFVTMVDDVSSYMVQVRVYSGSRLGGGAEWGHPIRGICVASGSRIHWN